MPEESNLKPEDILGSYTRDVLGVKSDEQQAPTSQKAEETKTETTAEVSKPAEEQKTQTEQVTPTVVPQQETDWFDLSKINTRFGTEFKSEEEIKEVISSLTENQEYLGKKDYYSEIERVFEEMQNQFSPENMTKAFGSKENYDKAIMHNVLSQSIPESISAAILTTDMSKADNLHVMFLEAIARDPNLLALMDETGIKKGLLARAGVDISDPEFDLAKYQEAAKANPNAMLNLSMGATQAKGYFKGLVDEARKSIPEIKDFKKEFEQRATERATILQKRTNEWTAKAKELSDQFKEFKIMEKDAQGKDVVDFTFTVPKEFTDSVANYLVDWAVSNGVDLTPETVARAQSEIQDAFEDQYRAEIRKAYKDEKLAKYKEELDNKVFNNKPINTQEAPEGHGKSYQDELEEQRKQFGLK